MGHVLDYIRTTTATRKMHMTVLDPASQSPERAGELADAATRAGTDAIMIGGSTGMTMALLHDTVVAVRANTRVPLIHFPTHAKAVDPGFDAIYFMSIMNSNNPRFIVREQLRGAPIVAMMKLEPISLGYVVVAPGMTVGRVAECDLIARGDVHVAVGYAMAAEMFGMSLFCLEAGSGAPEHVPVEMVRAVRGRIGLPLIVTGGLRTPEAIAAVCAAGADIVVSGTVVEEAADPYAALAPLIAAVRAAPRPLTGPSSPPSA